MSYSPSRVNRKISVIVNYISLFAFVLIFYLAQRTVIGWSIIMISAEVLAAILLVYSFIQLHVMTGLWRFAHSSMKLLDERQAHIVYESLRYSYAIFSVIVLVIMLYIAIVGISDSSFGVILANGMIYFAHTLPSSIIAWTEKELSSEGLSTAG